LELSGIVFTPSVDLDHDARPLGAGHHTYRVISDVVVRLRCRAWSTKPTTSTSPSSPASGTGETRSSAGRFFFRRCCHDAVLEIQGPAITEALRQLDRATTMAWKALGMLGMTDDEWELVKREIGIERAWDAAYQLASTFDLPSMQPSADVTADGP
jgi:hypothetical protein